MSDDQDQRTHAPTPRRLDEFRRRGEVARSRDLAQVAALGTGAIALVMVAPSVAASWRSLIGATIGDPGAPLERTLAAAHGVVVGAALPVGLAALGGFVVASGLQLGWPPALQAPSFDLGRAFSLRGLATWAPRKLAGKLVTSTLRLFGAIAAAAIAAGPELGRLASGPSRGAADTLRLLGDAGARVVWITGAILVALALVDYLHSRREIGAKMKMTREEVRRESREQEGDPQVRRRRRQRMRELARRRLVTAVETADVVLVNPTEYAVALRYQHSDGAPKVVAKGRGEVAERIRAVARKAGVPIVAKPPLCRLIHKLVPEGREIPASLYQAVAEVLAYVHRLRRRAR